MPRAKEHRCVLFMFVPPFADHFSSACPMGFSHPPWWTRPSGRRPSAPPGQHQRSWRYHSGWGSAAAPELGNTTVVSQEATKIVREKDIEVLFPNLDHLGMILMEMYDTLLVSGSFVCNSYGTLGTHPRHEMHFFPARTAKRQNDGLVGRGLKQWALGLSRCYGV